MMERDIYLKVVEELESCYAPVPNRSTFYRAIKEMLTPEDCELWLRFPKHSEKAVTLDEMEHDDIYNNCIQHLFDTAFLIEWNQENGVPHYVRSYIFQIMLSHSLPSDTSLLQDATRDWFNEIREGMSGRFEFESPEYRVIPHEGALTGDKEFGEFSLDMEIPDTRQVVTYDYVSEMVNSQELIIVGPCFCRSNKDVLQERECDHPIETCILFGKMAERNLKYGWGRKITAEDALEIVRKSRERGLVQCISNAKEPSILCNCCECCCISLASMSRHEFVAGKPSRYIASLKEDRCAGCGKCADVCPMHTYEIKDEKAVYDPNKCIGCGLCVTRCKQGALSLVLRKDADERYLPDRERLEVMFL
ncbi:MAG: 4Fe-4S binding protein [Eubacteriales bacterium]|nr:4Fe-4S binding protein [Eubacteriales bacterium]